MSNTETNWLEKLLPGAHLESRRSATAYDTLIIRLSKECRTAKGVTLFHLDLSINMRAFDYTRDPNKYDAVLSDFVDRFNAQVKGLKDVNPQSVQPPQLQPLPIQGGRDQCI